MGLKILETPGVIKKRMLLAMIDELNDVVFRRVLAAKTKIQEMLKTCIADTEEYKALQNGSLVGAFGFPHDSQKRLDAITNTIAKSIKLTKVPFRYISREIIGGAKVYMIIDDFSDILGINEAVITTEKGEKLPWLEWLLVKGDQYIISDYRITFKRGLGRSGLAIMQPSKGQQWRVDNRYSGTLSNNWIVRAVESHFNYIETTLTKILYEEIAKDL